jgi:hypothetical protein
VSKKKSSLLTLVERLQRKAPQYLDLLTATSDNDFDAAIDALLERAVSHLETNKLNFKALDEEGLSAVLAGTMSTFGIAVTQETNSNGHVDLTIEVAYCSPLRRVLGEAKIYTGPKYHVNGLKQLLGRYTTGREGRGLLIVYVRKKNIAELFKKLKTQMDSQLPMNQRGSTTDHVLKWSFLSKHGHSSGEDCLVGHIGCNLFIDQVVGETKGK